MSKWIPDRKILAGGVASVVAFLAVVAADQFLGFSLPMETAMMVVGGLGTLVAYMVPEKYETIFRKADAALSELGFDDTDDVPADPAA